MNIRCTITINVLRFLNNRYLYIVLPICTPTLLCDAICHRVHISLIKVLASPYKKSKGLNHRPFMKLPQRLIFTCTTHPSHPPQLKYFFVKCGIAVPHSTKTCSQQYTLSRRLSYMYLTYLSNSKMIPKLF